MAQRYAIQMYSVIVALFASYYCFATSFHLAFISKNLEQSIQRSVPYSLLHAEQFLARQGYAQMIFRPCAAEVDPVLNAPVDENNDLALLKELIAVFGQDSLWERTQKNYPKNIKKFGKSKKKTKVTAQPVSLTNPLTASWNTLSSLLPFSNGLDLGANSDSDVYVQFLAQKNGFYSIILMSIPNRFFVMAPPARITVKPT